MRMWFSNIQRMVLRGKESIVSWISEEREAYSESWLLFRLMKKTVSALFTCILALGGSIVGIVTGAIKGQTTETGIVRGAAVGAVTGAITAVQLMELMVTGEPFSKVALICSLINGKIFMEWVSPAVLKAYQWQISTTEASLRDISDIFEVNATKGLSWDIIEKLPKYKIHPTNTLMGYHEISCAICLQDFENGDSARTLPSCRHHFHLHCIDEWLIQHASCPICREDVNAI